ncbi:hypothetical protein O0I10_007870 [Lichtheimia ornata]|uniref:Cyclin N-terminal domain-containing protein n=1 Tax=Lichtheimia ornata TaxID=688661 RepID=A0AAD7UZU7_9FUNG|nr:uncharacterized protein O0I10_007870 [Lichtheimia ornata]KAJ8656547.1 hypothetical protein O0I10_007870 [Lichtheimia ornata]
MYDVYDMGNVHLPTITTTNSRSKTSSTSIPFIQLPPPIQSQPQFSPMYGKDASSTFTHAAYQNTQRAYQPCLKEAQGLYQALNMYHYTHPNEKLNPHCIRRLASYVVQAWEVDPSEASITEIASLMHHLLSTTASKNDTNEDMDTILMEYAHKQQSSMPTPCPNLTLLVAIRYIDRLKKRYARIRGAFGCSYRLVVVAYMMAAKYIHRNLRLVIPIPTLVDEQQHMHYARLSTERSTLKQEQQQQQPHRYISSSPPTPPASPNGSCSSIHSSSNNTPSPPPPATTSSSLLSPPSSSSNNQSVTQQALRALRMEIEFLHFLQYDLTCSDPTSLVRLAHEDPSHLHHSFPSLSLNNDE